MHVNGKKEDRDIYIYIYMFIRIDSNGWIAIQGLDEKKTSNYHGRARVWSALILQRDGDNRCIRGQKS